MKEIIHSTIICLRCANRAINFLSLTVIITEESREDVNCQFKTQIQHFSIMFTSHVSPHHRVIGEFDKLKTFPEDTSADSSLVFLAHSDKRDECESKIP